MPTDPGMQPTQTMQMPVQPSPEQPPRRSRRWLRWAIPLLAFLLGVGVGGAGDQTDPTATPQYQSLQAELASAEDEVAGAQAQITVEAEARLQQQMAGHQQAWALHDGYATDGADPALKQAASTALPIVEHHLSMLKSMPMANGSM